MARLLVGLPVLLGDLQKYKKRFDMVEVRPVDTSIPRASTLRAWRKSVPPGFVFSVVLPRAVGELVPGPALDEALAAAITVATTLEARCIVLPTPASVRPTAANRKRLGEIVARLPREGVAICWEPAGIWERDDIVATARAEGLLPVFDAARDMPAPGPIVYTRLRALGKGAALSAAAVERVADRLRGRREAFVVVEGAPDAARVKSALTAALAKQGTSGAGPILIRPAGAIPLIAEDEEQ